MIKKFIEHIENTSFFNALLIALISPIIRGVLEGAIDHNRMLTNPLEYKSILFIFLHQYSFFFAVYLSLVFLIKLIFPFKDPIKVMKFVFSTSVIIIMPPPIDAIFGGNFRPRYIFSIEEFFYSLLNVFNPFVQLDALSPGMRVELFFALIGIFVYTYIISKNILKSILTIISFVFITAVIGSLPAFIGRDNFRNFSLIETDTQRYALIDLYLFIIFLSLIFPRYLIKIFKMRTYKFLYYLPLLIFGFIVGMKSVKFTYFKSFDNVFDYLGVFNIILSLFLAFLTALILNDYYDREIDKINNKRNIFNDGVLSENEFFPIVSVFSLLSVSLALCTSYSVFVVLIVILSSAILYSLEPIRIKRFWLLSTLNLSFIALMSVVLGISYFYKENPLLILNEKIIVSIILGITFGFGIKDLSDVEGDRKGLIFTAYTLFGDFGRYVQGLLTSSSFLIISIILDLPFVIGAIFFIISFVASIQNKFYELVFLMLFSIFAMISFFKIYKDKKFFIEVSYNYSRFEIEKLRKLDLLEMRLNEILSVEPCNEDVRLNQVVLLYNLKKYEEIDSVARFLRENCYINAQIYHVWSLALWKLNNYDLAIEKAKISALLAENDAYWTLSAMYFLKGDKFKSFEYQIIAQNKRASNVYALTLFR
ncbi:MAG: UbiA family prenyltransferase [candidate division WOR-3 bacterium]